MLCSINKIPEFFFRKSILVTNHLMKYGKQGWNMDVEDPQLKESTIEQTNLRKLDKYFLKTKDKVIKENRNES